MNNNHNNSQHNDVPSNSQHTTTPDADNLQNEEELTEEELLKRKIEELRKRDPFIYR